MDAVPVFGGGLFAEFHTALQENLGGTVVGIEGEQLAEFARCFRPLLVAISVQGGVVALQQRGVGRLLRGGS